ncbi:hypothetical protein [Saccharopolyspora pogona]|uniref:hypothetical protein n=1 Tax=Saccharopolyspora pogona TaxID=333966 RepID=UPI00168A055B|nr:hypothetical protein [Saccharopolyspora pogona]
MPTAAVEYLHALGDETTWGNVTIQGLINNYLPCIPAVEAVPGDDWVRLRGRITASPQRLSRRATGGHLFFVGFRGARATVDHLGDLFHEVTELEKFLASISR